MDVIGIICEYSPLHNGHVYHINKIKELYKDSIIILVVSGYFLQRGDISIMNKEDKTLCALKNNVDLVVELPVIYSVQSADIFAKESIRILNELKVNKIVFGSEVNDIKYLENIAKKQLEDKDKLDSLIKENLKKGYSYPKSIMESLKIDTLKSNDLLGVSYIKTILENNYNIEYISIKRTNDYLNDTSCEDIISSSNIRKKIKDNLEINKYVPISTINYINEIDYKRLFLLLKYKILTSEDLNIYLDVSEGLDNKLKGSINKNARDIDSLIKLVKSKRYTYNKINRMLTHILLGIKKDINEVECNYIRVLGFNKVGRKYLNGIKKDINTTVDKDSIVYKYELIASSIYEMVSNSKCLGFELSKKPVNLDDYNKKM